MCRSAIFRVRSRFGFARAPARSRRALSRPAGSSGMVRSRPDQIVYVEQGQAFPRDDAAGADAGRAKHERGLVPAQMVEGRVHLKRLTQTGPPGPGRVRRHPSTTRRWLWSARVIRERAVSAVAVFAWSRVTEPVTPSLAPTILAVIDLPGSLPGRGGGHRHQVVFQGVVLRSGHRAG